MSALHLLSLLVGAAALFAWASRRFLRLPLTIGTMLLTVVASLLLRACGLVLPSLHAWASGLLHEIDFDRLILHGMLSLLLFAGAFLLDIEQLRREKLVVAVLATVGTVLSASLVAALMYYGLQALGFAADWRGSLLFGALISPTDPIAVLEMLRRVGVSRGLQAQLAGESLFNDGVGAVLFLTVLQSSPGTGVRVGRLLATLTWQVGGALALALAAAYLAHALMRRVKGYQIDIMLTLSLALGGYALAETLHLSAPLEAVFAAIALRQFNESPGPGIIAHESIDRFWEVIDEVQNAVLFVLVGLEVLAVAFTSRTVVVGLLAILAVLLTRLGVVALLIGLLRGTGRRFARSVAILSWGGLHGGLSLALALTIPAAASPTWLLPSTYLVVAFSVLIQGTSMPALLRGFEAVQPDRDHAAA